MLRIFEKEQKKRTMTMHTKKSYENDGRRTFLQCPLKKKKQEATLVDSRVPILPDTLLDTRIAPIKHSLLGHVLPTYSSLNRKRRNHIAIEE